MNTAVIAMIPVSLVIIVNSTSTNVRNLLLVRMETVKTLMVDTFVNVMKISVAQIVNDKILVRRYKDCAKMKANARNRVTSPPHTTIVFAPKSGRDAIAPLSHQGEPEMLP